MPEKSTPERPTQGAPAPDTTDPTIGAFLARLRTSRFRAGFHLDPHARAYLEEKGLEAVMTHGRDFIRRRIAPAHPARDGRQMPMRGHPVFIAQHATASCCRTCLAKWHAIPPGQALTAEEQVRVLAVIRAWIEREGAVPRTPAQGTLF